MPLFKKGDRKKGNCQFARLTSVIGKMFEPITKKVMAGHLENHYTITQSQRGLLKGKS